MSRRATLIRGDGAGPGILQATLSVLEAAGVPILDPPPFEVIVTTNLFGDILRDEIAGLVGRTRRDPGPGGQCFDAGFRSRR